MYGGSTLAEHPVGTFFLVRRCFIEVVRSILKVRKKKKIFNVSIWDFNVLTSAFHLASSQNSSACRTG